MNEKMIDAIRKEAFAQGFIRGRTHTCQSRLTDAEVLEMLPGIDEEYAKYRKERM